MMPNVTRDGRHALPGMPSLLGFGGFAGEKHLLDACDRRTRWLTLIGS